VQCSLDLKKPKQTEIELKSTKIALERISKTEIERIYSPSEPMTHDMTKAK